jgi:hypothetical protein
MSTPRKFHQRHSQVKVEEKSRKREEKRGKERKRGEERGRERKKEEEKERIDGVR